MKKFLSALLLLALGAFAAYGQTLGPAAPNAGTVTSITADTCAQTSTGSAITATGIIQLNGACTGYGTANCTLAASAGSSALTVALKDNAGSDPSATSPCLINFRNGTGTTGSTQLRSVTAATSIVVSSGSTLGVTSSTGFRVWVVAFDDSATVRLGVFNASVGTTAGGNTQIYPLMGDAIGSSTAEGGAGAADSAGVFYTGTAVTGKPYRVLGYLEWSASGLTAGTWTTTNLTRVAAYAHDTRLPGTSIQTKLATSAADENTTSSSFQASANLALSIVPQSAANRVMCQYSVATEISADAALVYTQLYNNTSAASMAIVNSGGNSSSVTRDYAHAAMGWDFPNSTSSQTYVVRYRNNNGSTRVDITPNGASNLSTLTCTEYQG